MKKLLSIACLFILCAFVHAEPPTKESVEKLLTLTEAEKLLISMQGQMDVAMKTGMEQAFRGKSLSEEEQKKIDSLRAKISTTLAEELSWANMKDMYIQAYSETFTQEEIDGLIAFYESPAGKAFVAKMPALMQKSMALTQQRIGPIIQKMQDSIKDSVQEIGTPPIKKD